MKAGIVFSISVGLALVLAGCGPDRTLFGTWKGDRDWKALHLDNEEFARHIAAVDLTLKSDGSFMLSDGGTPFTGSWVQSSKGVDLHIETIMNRPLAVQTEEVQKQTDFSLRLDKGQLFYKTPADTGEIELKKKAQP